MTETDATEARHRDHCPHCGVSLLGEVITGLDGEPRQLRREVGVEVSEIYDGILYDYCPDCGGAWHAWTKEFPARYEAAKWYVGYANVKAGVTR